MKCQNCEAEFEGKFCPNCSQKAATKRFTLGHFAHDVFHAVTHTDKGILFLIKEMFKRPGKVALEYNSGKRKKYFNPVTFLLITMALQVFAAQKSGIYEAYLDETEAFVEQMKKLSPETDQSDAEEQLSMARKQTPKVLENNRIITFLLIPLMSVLTWLFFKKSGHNYAENLVFNVFVQAQLYAYFILVVVFYLLFPGTVFYLMYAYILVGWVYWFVAYRQFFGQKKRWVILKGLTIQVLYFLFVQQISLLVYNYL